MSFGLPIIAPKKGCLPELISSQAGILYPDTDFNGLLHAMQSIRTMNLKDMGKAAHCCAENLHWENIGRATLDVYTRLIKSNRKIEN